jgi:hypothetical protein
MVYSCPFQPDEMALQLETAHTLIRFYLTRCIHCHLLQSTTQGPHLFRDCEALSAKFEEWVKFKNAITFTKGTCYQCGLPQKVGYIFNINTRFKAPFQLNYTNNQGEIIFYHDYQDEPQPRCLYAQVLVPMLFTIVKNDGLHQRVLKSHLTYRDTHKSFVDWVIQPNSSTGIPNILAVSFLFLPKMD